MARKKVWSDRAVRARVKAGVVAATEQLTIEIDRLKEALVDVRNQRDRAQMTFKTLKKAADALLSAQATTLREKQAVEEHMAVAISILVAQTAVEIDDFVSDKFSDLVAAASGSAPNILVNVSDQVISKALARVVSQYGSGK